MGARMRSSGVVPCSPNNPHINYLIDLQIKGSKLGKHGTRTKSAVPKLLGITDHHFIS